jgi:uncharacterized membrane protein
MKKLLLSIGLILYSAIMFAQSTATLSFGSTDLTGYNPGDKVYVPINCDAITPPATSGFQFFIEFDHTVLSWDGSTANPLPGAQNFHPNIQYNSSEWLFFDNGVSLGCSFLDNNFLSRNINSGETFLVYVFTYLGGETELVWQLSDKGNQTYKFGKGVTEMYDENFEYFDLTLIDGCACFANYDVTFHVTDNQNGIDLEGALITVGSESLLTDAQGEAVFSLADGNYTYLITKADYTNKSGIFVVAGADLTIPVALNCLGCEVDITFQVTSGGSNLAGATVMVGSETATTSATGEAIISLADGDYTYTISNYGYLTQTAPFTVAGAAMFIPVDMPMLPHYDILFHAMASGTDLEGALVSLTGDVIMSMTTDLSGEALFSLVDGTYNYTVSKTGYSTETGSITVNGAGFTVDVVLAALYDVTFHVTSAGFNLQGAAVTVGTQTKITNASGNAVFSLADGDYNYLVTLFNYNEVPGAFTVAGANQTIDVTMVMITYEITFNVTDAVTNLPIEGAVVSVDADFTLTNSSGVAIFNLPDGSYFYSVSKDGYSEVSDALEVAGSNITFDITLTPINYFIIFHVTSEGINLENALVTIGSESVPTNNLGQAFFSLTNGNYSYTITKEGFDDLSGNFTVNSVGQTIEIVMFATLYEITFHVTSGGADLSDVNITVGTTTIPTGTNGIAIFSLSNGVYSYSAEKAGYVTQNGPFTVSNGPQTIDLNMPEQEYPVTFIVKDQNNQPVAGVVVTVDGQSLTTPANGTVVFQLVNGTYPWTATKAGYTPASGNVVVNGAAVTVNVTLPQITYATTFVVKDQNNQPIQGAVVTVTGFPPQTTPANGTVIFNLPNGTYPWTATKAGYTSANGNVVVNGAAQTVNVTLQTTYATTFVVKDQGNLPLAGAVVTVNGQSQTTPTNGTVVFQLVNGTYPYSVVKNLYQVFEETVVVNNAAQTVNVNMTLIGIEDITSSSFNVYPNPSNGTFNLTTSAVMGYDSNVSVYDLAGKLVYTRKLEGNDLNVIDLSAQEKGMYIMQIIVEDKVYNKTLVIQ